VCRFCDARDLATPQSRGGTHGVAVCVAKKNRGRCNRVGGDASPWPAATPILYPFGVIAYPFG